MKITFNTHVIYITLHNKKIYSLKSKYTRIEVTEMQTH